KHRPKPVGDWINRARPRNYTPNIENLTKFANKWRLWWTAINPAWRRTQSAMLCDEDKPLSSMDIHGQNSFLNVLMALKWWRDSTSVAVKEWDEGVADVTWVFSAGWRKSP
ncbi:hypothetical protein C8R44DRAFT_621889, partial [Mycena epipterygia]